MTYSISCVLVIPNEHRTAINAVAEALGYGPNNLSIELRHTVDNSVWWGCHTWCEQTFIDQLQNPPSEVALIEGGEVAVAALICSAVENGDAYSNWLDTLSSNGLQIYVSNDPI